MNFGAREFFARMLVRTDQRFAEFKTGCINNVEYMYVKSVRARKFDEAIIKYN